MKAEGLPELSEIVTESYLDFIVKSGKWTDHGEYIDRYFEDNGIADLMDDTEALKEHLEMVYFPKRYKFVKTNLSTELEMLSEKPAIYRAMKIPAKCWPDFKKHLGEKPLGVYWSTSRPDFHCGDQKRGVGIFVEAVFEPSQVNWIETIRSRMDYDLGDDEEEMQLFSGVVPKIIGFEFDTVSEEVIPDALSVG